MRMRTLFCPKIAFAQKRGREKGSSYYGHLLASDLHFKIVEKKDIRENRVAMQFQCLV